MKKLMIFSLAFFWLAAVSYAKNPYRVGDYASDFTLKNINGEPVTLSALQNTKGYILVFISNACPVSKQYEQRIKDLNYEYAGRGYPVVTISSNDRSASPDDSPEEMQKTAKENDYQFQVLIDEGQEVAREYGARNTPEVFVLSKQNSYLKIEYVGAIDNNSDDGSAADRNYVKDAVDALLKGEQIPVTFTKTEGCGIKWSPVMGAR